MRHTFAAATRVSAPEGARSHRLQCRAEDGRQSMAALDSYQGTVLHRGSVGAGGTWGTVVMHDGADPVTPTRDTVVRHGSVRKPAGPRAFGRGSALPSTRVRPAFALLFGSARPCTDTTLARMRAVAGS